MIWIPGVIDDNGLAYGLVFIIGQGIIHIAKNGAERVFIQVSIAIAYSIPVDAIYGRKPEVTAYKNIGRTFHIWRELVLHFHFDHAIIFISRLIGDLEFNEDPGSTRA
jgi:hypothetical protein